MIKSIKKIAQTGPGNLQVLNGPVIDNSFRVDAIILRIAAVIKNNNVAAQVLDGDLIGHNWQVDYAYADGKKWYDALPCGAVERVQQQTAKNFLTSPIELARSAAAGSTSAYAAIGDVVRSFQNEFRSRRITAVAGATQTETFRLMLPLARPNASNPVDYSQSLSLLGQLYVKLTNDTGSADLVIDSFSVEVLAIGERVDNFYAGIRQRHSIQGAQTPNADDSVSIKGNRLLALHIYSTDSAGSPVAGVNPQVKLDDQTVVEFRDGQTVADLNKLAVVVDGNFPADSERDLSGKAILVVSEPYKHSIFDLPQTTAVQLHYSSNPGTAGKHFIVTSVAFPKSDRCRAALYPGATAFTPEQLAAYIRVLGRTPNAPEVLSSKRDWLPEEVLTPQARGAACD